MREIDTKFELFKSIVQNLDRYLFPSGEIRNEASDVEIADKVLNSPDIERFLNKDFIKEMKDKLELKATGLIKQAEKDRSILSKFSFSQRDE